MKRLICSIVILSTLIVPKALAASAAECRERVHSEIAREQRLYRAYLFGKKQAHEEPLESVRFDRSGLVWVKEEENLWIHNIDAQLNDANMDIEDEHSEILPIKGIFETKRTLTSELIPYMLQSIRALECRLETLCDIAIQSQVQLTTNAVNLGSIQVPGCKEFTDLQSWPECHFAIPGTDILDQSDSQSYCKEMKNQLLIREAELLKLAVEYDAGYRSLLQFAGSFDSFLEELRWPFATTLKQAAWLIGQLQRIPCFISSCDSSPPVQ